MADPASLEPQPPLPEKIPAQQIAPSKVRQGFFRLSYYRGASEVKVFQHSRIFYWWPVWLFGFLFGFISLWGDHQAAIMPEGSRPETVTYEGRTREAMVAPEGKKLPTRNVKRDDGTIVEERIIPIAHVSAFRGMGTVYLAILLLVIIFTTMAFRGLISVFLLVILVGIALIVWVLGWWDDIFARLGQFLVVISAGFYLAMASVMFFLWLINVLVLDKQTYMVFSPGQIRINLVFGGGEMIYQAKGASIQLLKGDFIRHAVLGLGSGDFEIHVQGLRQPLELHNVLRAAAVLAAIEEVLPEQNIVTQAAAQA